MSVHPDPDVLAAVALGEHPAPGVERHLANCRSCATDLAALRRLAADLSAIEAAEWLEPPATVWAGIQRGLGTGPAPAPAVSPAAGRPRWLPLALAGAAAAGVLAGVLGARLWTPATEQAPAPQVMASTSLATLDDQRVLGEASLVRTPTGMELAVTTEPLDPGSGFLEVWLINTDGVRMVSVGVLADNTSGVFSVSEALLGQGYRIVDVSRELFDDQPTHSGDSLVRGELAV